jgi:hypothetical protein
VKNPNNRRYTSVEPDEVMSLATWSDDDFQLFDRWDSDGVLAVSATFGV